MNLRTIALAWMMTTAVCYFSLAIFAPSASGDEPLVGAIGYGMLGLGFFFAAMLPYCHAFPFEARILQFVLGVILAWGAMWSWMGLGLWNVPFSNKEIFQVSMATLNVLIAVFAFSLALDESP